MLFSRGVGFVQQQSMTYAAMLLLVGEVEVLELLLAQEGIQQSIACDGVCWRCVSLWVISAELHCVMELHPWRGHCGSHCRQCEDWWWLEMSWSLAIGSCVIDLLRL